MNKILEICEGKNNARSFRNPTPEAIDRAIDGLIPAMYHFVILEADPPVEKCAYIQTIIETGGKAGGNYLVETRYVFSGGFRHYRKHVENASEVKKLFLMFSDGVAPNTAGWEEITEKLIRATG